MSKEMDKYKTPDSWQNICLSDVFYDPKNDIVSGPFGSNLKASEYMESGVPILRIQNIKRNAFINKNIKYVSHNKAEELNRHNYKKGDIVITKLGDPVGKACIIPKYFDNGIIIADLVRASLNHRFVSKKFIVFQLNSEGVIRQFKKQTKGTTRPRVSLNQVRELNIVLPPLNEQHLIVAKLEELFSELDNSVISLKKVKRQLKAYRQALLKNAFEGKLTEKWREVHKDQLESASLLLEQIKEEGKNNAKRKQKNKPLFNLRMPQLPEKWCWSFLSDLGELNRGKSKHRPRNDPKLFGGKYPFIQTGAVRNSKGLITEYTQTYNEIGLAQSKLWPINTLCITIAANIAETSLLGIEACFPDSIVGFIADNRISVLSYVHYFMKTIQSKLESFAPATAQKNINLNILKDVMVPLPSIEEQRKIVEKIERQFSIADEAEKTINQSLKQAEHLRQSILKKAFEGKLVEQDPNDESVSVLLKRIKEEKKKYLSEIKEAGKKLPKERKTMETTKQTILEILQKAEQPISAKKVWEQSEHKGDIEAFYAELKKIKSQIIEVKKETDALLSVKK